MKLDIRIFSAPPHPKKRIEHKACEDFHDSTGVSTYDTQVGDVKRPPHRFHTRDCEAIAIRTKSSARYNYHCSRVVPH